LDAIKRIWPVANDITVLLGDDHTRLINEFEQVKDDIKQCEIRKSEIEAELRYEMKDATFGALPDGRIVTLKTTKRAGYTATIEPTEFRTLRITKRK
jgi:predicted phage-related endonuclease